MKSTIKEKEAKQAKVKYPCLMERYDPTHMIVLFQKSGVGQIIYPIIGTPNDSIWDILSFTPFDGVVELSND